MTVTQMPRGISDLQIGFQSAAIYPTSPVSAMLSSFETALPCHAANLEITQMGPILLFRSTREFVSQELHR